MSAHDAGVTLPSAMDWGKLMIRCFWEHFATFDPMEDVGIVLQREEPSFTEGVMRFLKQNKYYCRACKNGGSGVSPQIGTPRRTT